MLPDSPRQDAGISTMGDAHHLERAYVMIAYLSLL